MAKQINREGGFLQRIIPAVMRDGQVGRVNEVLGLPSFEMVRIDGVDSWIYKQTSLCQSLEASQVAVIIKMNIHRSTPSYSQIVIKGQD